MKLLFTGASGFLGKNIMPILSEVYEIKTLGLSHGDDFKHNMAREIPALNCRFNTVLHAAGKAHVVPKSEGDKQVFYDVNFEGTKNLCCSLEKNGLPQNFIFISTVAVYGCEFGENISEKHPLDGTSAYARSKILAENFLIEWCEKNNVCLSIIRPSLIAGPNAPGNLGAMVSGIKSGKYLSINKGMARKSVLMIQDIANLIPLLEDIGGVYNVCDSNHPSFRELENIICSQLNKNKPLSIPLWLANIIAKCGDIIGSNAPINTLKLQKITKSLTFSNEKACKELGWKPMSVVDNYRIV